MSAKTTEPLTDAIQHYVREIYKLESAGARATTSSVAQAMQVSPASASVMLKRLAALDLVEHVPYRGVALTDAGRRVALELIRDLEHMDRERYAGPVGWVDADGNGEWGIALRCGQLSGRTARLFAGCGIVAGSEPAAELAETLVKLQPMRGALEG